MTVIKQKATYADIEALPEHKVGELIGGELFVSPRPSFRHANVTSSLGGIIRTLHPEGGGWVILDEPELHFGHDVVVPDIAGWRRERFPLIKDNEDPAFFTLAPDWVCEVLSPSTERLDRTKKMNLYLMWGVEYVWFVKPLTRILEAYQRTNEQWSVLGNYSEGVVQIPPFEAMPFRMEAIWGW